MSEQNKPLSGEWWLNDNGERVRIVGWSFNGRLYFEHECGTVLNRKPAHTHDWKHLPNCTGWDWQPEPEPEWFDLTPFDGHVLRKNTDWGDCSDPADWVQPNWPPVTTTVDRAKSWGWTRFRCLLKDAPPELVAKASKPAEDPDEWVTQDRVSERQGLDEYRFVDQCNNAKSEWKPCIVSTNTKHGMSLPKGFIELRCRRRDLPPMPEKPKTEREVSLYWYDGSVVGRYADCPPSDPSFVPLIVRDGKVFIETETREVVR